jgi:hypothetical protein
MDASTVLWMCWFNVLRGCQFSDDGQDLCDRVEGRELGCKGFRS